MIIDTELENLRLQIRDRDLEILSLRAIIRESQQVIEKMKCCENCQHYAQPGDCQSEICRVPQEKCTVENYEAWRLRK